MCVTAAVTADVICMFGDVQGLELITVKNFFFFKTSLKEMELWEFEICVIHQHEINLKCWNCCLQVLHFLWSPSCFLISSFRPNERECQVAFRHYSHVMFLFLVRIQKQAPIPGNTRAERLQRPNMFFWFHICSLSFYRMFLDYFFNFLLFILTFCF